MLRNVWKLSGLICDLLAVADGRESSLLFEELDEVIYIMDATLGGDFLYRLGSQLQQSYAVIDPLFVHEFCQGAAIFSAEEIGQVTGIDI